MASSRESHKLTYNVHQKYNNLVAYHNDLEYKIIALKDEQSTARGG